MVQKPLFQFKRDRLSIANKREGTMRRTIGLVMASFALILMSAQAWAGIGSINVVVPKWGGSVFTGYTTRSGNTNAWTYSVTVGNNYVHYVRPLSGSTGSPNVHSNWVQTNSYNGPYSNSLPIPGVQVYVQIQSAYITSVNTQVMGGWNSY